MSEYLFDVSVVIPVYNVEAYLDRCVKSVLAQTLPNIEIILVDDGSPDMCPKMCDEYAKMDSRIRVIHQPNGGQSSARKAGISIAKGQYVCLVDSDDYVEPTMYEELYRGIVDFQAEIAQIGRDEIDEQGNLMTLELMAPDQRQAVRLSKLFEKKAEDVYNLTMAELLDEEDALDE